MRLRRLRPGPPALRELLAEEEVEQRARIDGLTEIPNRRTFDEFLQNEWKRCFRLEKPICLAMIDLDNFKQLNDNFGHQSGDKCLKQIGKLLSGMTKRPGDICARYGGDEFALIWSDTLLEQAEKLSLQIIQSTAALKITVSSVPSVSHLSVSIGLSQMLPANGGNECELISRADTKLYEAKSLGRNRLVY